MAHALLSPSSAKRWMSCPPSARLEQMFPDMPTSFAEEGTLAHAMAARQLKGYLGEPFVEEDEVIRAIGSNHDFMACVDHASAYAGSVIADFEELRKTTHDARLFVERELNLDCWVPDSFGTADAIIIADGVMHVYDFKYGRGVLVSADDNTQMKLYALGALSLYEVDFGVEEVWMHIVQPRMNNNSVARIDVMQLKRWAETDLRRGAMNAYLGRGECKEGEWCKFCKALGGCRQNANNALRGLEFADKVLSADELARDVLPRVPAIKQWCAAVTEEAQRMAERGEKIEGYELKEARPRRSWNDEAALSEYLADMGMEREEYMHKREMLSPAQLEKKIGRKKFAEIAERFVKLVPGNKTLVKINNDLDILKL